ncbi:MAG: carbohydrate ABC transporter permease [Clostridiales bacterium]|jgi:ABC-type glycerol-3-phosphate transport system permease component|nr:carbohydrate ABC transporter permease [Clostridiales bacterium]MDR2749829.1 carbohydrate ABC transporter permease [Clostridiales bacterium]
MSLQSAWRKLKFHRKNRSLSLDVILALVLGSFGLFSVWPLVYIASSAFKPLNEIFLFPPRLFVMRPTLNNFRDLSLVMNTAWIPVSRYVFNTVLITALGTAGSVFIGSMAAFPLAKFKFPGSAVMSGVIVYSLMFSSSVTAIPNYLIMSKLRLIDTYWAVILPAAGSTLGVFLMRNFMTQIPDSLIDSAKIDGAGDMTVFMRIAMPISKPAWITLVILSFQSLWGTTGGTFLYTEKLKPVSYALTQIVSAGVARTGVAAAVSLIMLAVPVGVFIFAQSNVIETMANSGIKG